MSFDIQSAWDSDKGDDIKIPATVSKLKPANVPLDAIRKNMRNELVPQVLALIGIGFFPKFLNLMPIFNTWFYSLYIMLVMVSVYYLSKLYFFYRRISSFDNNTKDGLYEMYYDIRLNIETYRTFTFIILPFVLLMVLMYLVSADQEHFLALLETNTISQQLIFKGVLVFAVMFGSVIAATELWLQYGYLKYARAIKKVLEELKEE